LLFKLRVRDIGFLSILLVVDILSLKSTAITVIGEESN
jgi:hypothetical protein